MSSNIQTVDLQKIDLQLLYQYLNDTVQQGIEAIVKGCHILGELKRRGESHPLMFNGIFKWFERVCDGSLDPAIITKFLGDEQIISRVIALPVKQQAEILENSSLKIVEIDNRTGKFVEIEKPLTRMSLRQLDQVFHDGEIRSFHDQLKIVKADAPKRPEPTLLVNVNKQGNFLVIAGQYTITMDMLIEPFRALDWEPPRKRSKTK